MEVFRFKGRRLLAVFKVKPEPFITFTDLLPKGDKDADRLQPCLYILGRFYSKEEPGAEVGQAQANVTRDGLGLLHEVLISASKLPGWPACLYEAYRMTDKLLVRLGAQVIYTDDEDPAYSREFLQAFLYGLGYQETSFSTHIFVKWLRRDSRVDLTLTAESHVSRVEIQLETSMGKLTQTIREIQQKLDGSNRRSQLRKMVV